MDAPPRCGCVRSGKRGPCPSRAWWRVRQRIRRLDMDAPAPCCLQRSRGHGTRLPGLSGGRSQRERNRSVRIDGRSVAPPHCDRARQRRRRTFFADVSESRRQCSRRPRIFTLTPGYRTWPHRHPPFIIGIPRHLRERQERRKRVLPENEKNERKRVLTVPKFPGNEVSASENEL